MWYRQTGLEWTYVWYKVNMYYAIYSASDDDVIIFAARAHMRNRTILWFDGLLVGHL